MYLKSKITTMVKSYTNIKIPAISMTFYIALLFGCKNIESDNIEIFNINYGEGEDKKPVKAIEYAVEAPPFSDGIFPCTDCHANFAPNPVRRELVEWHDDISALFRKQAKKKGCCGKMYFLHSKSQRRQISGMC
jgi:hypothetical protein